MPDLFAGDQKTGKRRSGTGKAAGRGKGAKDPKDPQVGPDAVADLTLALLYLTRFSDPRNSGEKTIWQAWKGYDSGALEMLEEAGWIAQRSRRAKSVFLTEEGMARAKELLRRYGLAEN